jgi:F-type H+-transporting ATPase subunit epsilon
MSAALQLRIATPLTLLVEQSVLALRAEDASGSFGVRPGHADLLTVLVPTVLRWRDAQQNPYCCAVSGGVLTVQHGDRIEVACREAILGDSLQDLLERVAHMRDDQIEAARRVRAEQVALHARTVRQLVKYLRPGSETRASW